MERNKFQPTLSIVKMNGRYRVSCLSKPYEEFRDFLGVFERIHNYALTRPEMFERQPLLSGLSNSELNVILGIRAEICSCLEAVAIS